MTSYDLFCECGGLRVDPKDPRRGCANCEFLDCPDTARKIILTVVTVGERLTTEEIAKRCGVRPDTAYSQLLSLSGEGGKFRRASARWKRVN